MKRFFPIIGVLIILISVGCTAAGGQESDYGYSLRTDSMQRGPYRIELRYPEGDIEFGTTVEIVLRVEYPEGEGFFIKPPAMDDKYSNTILNEIREDETLLSGQGTAVSTIRFSLEAWLPGELLFPPMTVVLNEEFTTAEVIINAVSAFDDPAAERTLSPLYVPESGGFPVWIPLAPVVVITGAAVTVILLVRRRRKRRNIPAAVMSREELIEDFRNQFMDGGQTPPLKQAFAALLRIPGAEIPEEYRILVNEARFSKNGISDAEGMNIIGRIYEQLIAVPGGENEF